MKKEKNVKVLNYWDGCHFSSRLSSSVILINSTRILACQTDLLKKMTEIWLSTSGGLTRKLTQKWLMSFNNLEWTYWLCVQSNDGVCYYYHPTNIFVDMCQRTLTHPEAVDCFKQSGKKEGHLVKRTHFYP